MLVGRVIATCTSVYIGLHRALEAAQGPRVRRPKVIVLCTNESKLRSHNELAKHGCSKPKRVVCPSATRCAKGCARSSGGAEPLAWFY